MTMRRLVISGTVFVFSLVWLFGTESIAAGAAATREPGAGARLSLRDAVELALARHPTLAISRAARDQAEAALDEVSSARLPAVRVDASATRSCRRSSSGSRSSIR
jgi:outer membrane protein TolC